MLKSRPGFPVNLNRGMNKGDKMNKELSLDLKALVKCSDFVSNAKTRQVLQAVCIDNSRYVATGGQVMIAHTHTALQELSRRVLIFLTPANISDIKKSKKLMANLNLQTGILRLGESEILIKYELDGERDYNYPNWKQVIPESKTISKVDSFAFDTVLTAKFKEMIEVFATTKYGQLVVYPLQHKNYIAVVVPCRADDARDHSILDTIRK